MQQKRLLYLMPYTHKHDSNLLTAADVPVIVSDTELPMSAEIAVPFKHPEVFLTLLMVQLVIVIAVAVESISTGSTEAM